MNFKEPEAVRALTCTLLKEDFGLTIEIPLERLIPTVPLRLNYIHWVEDLIDGQKQPRRGIDIGIVDAAFIHTSYSVPQVCVFTMWVSPSAGDLSHSLCSQCCLPNPSRHVREIKHLVISLQMCVCSLGLQVTGC